MKNAPSNSPLSDSILKTKTPFSEKDGQYPGGDRVFTTRSWSLSVVTSESVIPFLTDIPIFPLTNSGTIFFDWQIGLGVRVVIVRVRLILGGFLVTDALHFPSRIDEPLAFSNTWLIGLGKG